ncbi:MAG TPA: maleylpyruvate isomerase N-terminal domain-containing protein [Streptosporangiaceae bacterium]
MTATLEAPGGNCGNPADCYLAAAAAAADLVSSPEVSRRWDEPSALPGMTVGALAGHLARQILLLGAMLDAAGPHLGKETRVMSLLEHYRRAPWATAGRDDEPNVSIRASATAAAGPDPAILAARTRAALARLASRLPEEDLARPVLLPWGPWWLTLADLLRTRMLEIAVHDDDLAYSVGLPAPELPQEVTGMVITLLAALATDRHGPVAMIRALARAERAPGSIAAF